MAKTQTSTALLTYGATNVAAATPVNSAVLNTTGVDGGVLTFAIQNGGTGPTVQCEAKVFISHSATLPAAAAEGTGDSDWKQVYVIGGGTTASAKTRGVYRFGPEVKYLMVRFDSNTVQAVGAEAHVTTYTYS